MIYVLAELKAKPGKEAELIAGALPCIAATRKEAGCLFYDLTRSATEPDRFTFVERWSRREALEAHFHTPHIATWRAYGKSCIAAAKVEVVHTTQVETL